jgi:hypothetical protein
MRHIRKPTQMQLVRNGNRLRRPVTVLAKNQVRFTAARVVTLECIRPMQQYDHVGILFEGIVR